MRNPMSYVFHWGALATQAPCRPGDQRLIREARESGSTPPDAEPRGFYPRRLVAAEAAGDNRDEDRR